MELTTNRLIRFDLIEKLEESIILNQGTGNLIEYLTTMQAIQSVDQFIKDSPSFPGSTDKIIRDELVSAIGATLAIEGTKLGREEIEESFRKADLKERLKRKEQEAENSRKVYKFIEGLARDNEKHLQYSEELIKQIHKYFTDSMNYLSNTPGGYRGNFVATFGHPRRKGLCRNKSEIQKAMSNFVRGLNTKGNGVLSSNSIVKAIMSHYYLTEIHPFGDGNGRTARALEALILYVNGVNNYCFWSLANFWSTHRDEYIIHLGNIRSTCNPWEFVIWGMKGYLKEIERTKGLILKKVKQLMLIDYAKYLLDNKKSKKVKINQRILAVLTLLVRLEKIPLYKFQFSPEVSALYENVSSSTKYRDFEKMLNLKLINIFEENKETFIEPDFRTLDSLRYNI